MGDWFSHISINPRKSPEQDFFFSQNCERNQNKFTNVSAALAAVIDGNSGSCFFRFGSRLSVPRAYLLVCEKPTQIDIPESQQKWAWNTYSVVFVHASWHCTFPNALVSSGWELPKSLACKRTGLLKWVSLLIPEPPQREPHLLGEKSFCAACTHSYRNYNFARGEGANGPCCTQLKEDLCLYLLPMQDDNRV